MWPLNIMMGIDGFESGAENCRAVVVDFLCAPESLGEVIKDTGAWAH